MDTLNGAMGVESQDKEYYDSMSNYEMVDGTPFVLVANNGKWLIVMGSHQVSSKLFDTIEEAELYINSKPYELIYVGAQAYNVMLEEIKLREIPKMEIVTNDLNNKEDEQEN